MRSYIYGMGKNGISIYLKMLEVGCEISGFIDQNEVKQQRGFNNVPCISLDKYKKIAKKDDLIIVSVKQCNIDDLLKRHGYNTISSEKILEDIRRLYSPIQDINEVKRLYECFYKGADCINEYIAGK